MAGRHSPVWRPIGLALALTAGMPCVAWAQTAPATRPTTGITASFGVGLGVQYCCPDEPVRGMTGSIQVPLGSRWFVEGQFQVPTTTESTQTYRVAFPGYVVSGASYVTDRRFSGGGSVLYRFIAGRRVSAFAGGGLTFRHRTNSYDSARLCEPIAPRGCDDVYVPPKTGGYADNYWLPQASAGIDVSVTKFVTLFGALRIDDGVTSYGGVRVAITTRPAVPLTGPVVRVRSTDGSEYHGRLVSLTTSEVVIKQSGRSVVLPIGDVQRVEKASHRIRNGMITGAILGYVAGYFLSCGSGDEEDCWPEVGLLVAGIGTGAGALLGWSSNQHAAHDGRDVLYAGSGHAPASLQLAPLVSPRRAGIGMLLRW